MCGDVGSGREVCKWSKNLKCKARNATLYFYCLPLVYYSVSFIIIVLLELALYNCVIISSFINYIIFLRLILQSFTSVRIIVIIYYFILYVCYFEI